MKMATCVIFATKGRPDALAATIGTLRQQTQQPDCIVVSCVSDADVGDLRDLGDVTLVKGPAGLTRQRNAGLRAVPSNSDIVVFFDDDFVPHSRWMEEVTRFFGSHSNVVGVTGNLLADGIKGPGLGVAEALRTLESAEPDKARWVKRPYSPYGCNMAFRWTAIADLTFDERLVLYGWQEDRDFGAQAAKRGELVQLGSAMGVHLGVKGGRVSGRKLGYSQVANPLYLFLKGTMTLPAALSHISRNFVSNLIRSVRPEPYIDRLGRLRGNLAAIWDGANGRVCPEKAEKF
jgi:GT2 family glycosyltransferase